MIGIYKITNKVNDKCYVGQSIDIDRRFKEHRSGLNKKVGHNPYFQNAWDKYGEDNFEFEILEEVKDTNLLDEREIYYISFYKSNDRDYGYNATPGGNCFIGREEARSKLSISKRFNNSHLTEQDVREIKMCMYCLMDRKEIAKKYNVSEKVLTQISMGKSYDYVNSELNEQIHNLKQKMIDERNKEILKLYDRGYRIIDIINEMELSESIVSKCVHKYRSVPNKNYNEERLKVYGDIMNLYEQGYNRNQISQMLNQPTTTVYRYTTEGFDMESRKELPFKKVTEEIHNQIIDKYFNKNMSIKDICNFLDLSRGTVEYYINKYKYANTEIS